MVFSFKEISATTNRIESLGKELEQLKTSIAPYLSVSKDAIALIEQVGELKSSMLAKGVSSFSMRDWAIGLYEAGCGEVFPSTSSDNLAGSIRTALEKETTRLTESLRDTEDERDVLDDKLTELTDQFLKMKNEVTRQNIELQVEISNHERHHFNSKSEEPGLYPITPTSELEEISPIEPLIFPDVIAMDEEDIPEAISADQELAIEPQQEIEEKRAPVEGTVELVPMSEWRVLQLDDVVSIPTGGVGTVVRFADGGKIEVRSLVSGKPVTLGYNRNELLWLSSYVLADKVAKPEPVVIESDLELSKKFLGSISRSTLAWTNLTWANISTLVGGRLEAFETLRTVKGTAKQTERQTQLFEGRISELLLTHISHTGDNSPLDYIPQDIKEQLDILRGAKSTVKTITPFRQITAEGENWTVIEFEPGSGWAVCQAVASTKRKSFHISEMESLDTLPLLAIPQIEMTPVIPTEAENLRGQIELLAEMDF